MLVLDASVLANVIGDDGADGARGRAAIASHADLAIPDLAKLEVVAVLRKRWLAGDLDDKRFRDAVDDLAAFGLHRYPSVDLLGRVYELRRNLSAYDAAYVALAETLGWPLLTADARLARASGPTCEIIVVRPVPAVAGRAE
ncbi:MAG: type II toxin-antitoxin system VapC family toxin [Acidimicrobiales bacterium]